MAKLLLVLLAFAAMTAAAMPLAAPGDMRLRHDLQLLNDTGVINVPLTAWPVSLADVHNALSVADVSDLSGGNSIAAPFSIGSASQHPRIRASFEVSKIPREKTVRYRPGSVGWENVSP
jgi:hypothetical protein